MGAGRGSPLPAPPSSFLPSLRVFVSMSSLHGCDTVHKSSLLIREGVGPGIQSMLQTPITVLTSHCVLFSGRPLIFQGDWLQILYSFNTFIYWWGHNLFSYWGEKTPTVDQPSKIKAFITTAICDPSATDFGVIELGFLVQRDLSGQKGPFKGAFYFKWEQQQQKPIYIATQFAHMYTQTQINRYTYT